jgi:hypothetical protein
MVQLLPYIPDFSDSDNDYSDTENMVRSPPKKPKKNNIAPKYTADPADDLSDENNAIMTPVIQTSSTTTMQPAAPIMVSRFRACLYGGELPGKAS